MAMNAYEYGTKLDANKSNILESEQMKPNGE